MPEQDTWRTVELAVIVFLVAAFGGYFPRVVTSRNDGPVARRMMLHLNALSGGVLLSAGLTHLLPDAVENLEDVHWFGNLPTAFVLATMSFVVLLLVEHWTEQYMKNSVALVPCREPTEYGASQTLELQAVHRRPHAGESEDETAQILEADGETGSKLSSALVMFVSLGVHSLLEGLGMGASEGLSQFGIFLAIVAHKALAALALGTAFVKTKVSPLEYHVYILSFSFATPLGAVLGAVLADASADSEPAAYCTALAAGTFIFVACMEIIPELFHVHEGCAGSSSHSRPFTTHHSSSMPRGHVHSCDVPEAGKEPPSCIPPFLLGCGVMSVLSAYV